MKKKKHIADLNRLAHSIVGFATEEEIQPESEKEKPVKNQHAVELGRLGGLKGGKARAISLTKEKRSQIASKAARARWNKKDEGKP
ncbi:MAG: hypothetical protein ACE5GM_11265 [bacterium]